MSIDCLVMDSANLTADISENMASNCYKPQKLKALVDRLEKGHSFDVILIADDGKR